MQMVSRLQMENIPPSELAIYLAMTVVAIILFVLFIIAMSGRWGSTAEVGFTAVAITALEPPGDKALGRVDVILSTGATDSFEIGPKIAEVLEVGAMGALDVRKGRVYAWYPEGLSDDEAMLLRIHYHGESLPEESVS